jgi:N-acetylglucosaminyl-diphospho-decaprenol L-rhamnosyltransferase
VHRLLTQDPRVGLVGFRLRHGDGSEQLSSGSYPTLASTLVRILVPRARRKYPSPGVDESRPVPWVTGCCMLIRKECLDQLAGFDDEFFLYYEDVDFCRRAWAAGWSVWYQAFPFAVHHRPLHKRRVSTSLRIFTRHALLTYAAKHWPKWQFLSMTIIVRIEALFRQAVADWRGNARGVAGFKELGRICEDMAMGRKHKARRRLERIIRDEELHGAA